MAAYLMLVNELLTSSASARLFAPSYPMPVAWRLQTRATRRVSAAADTCQIRKGRARVAHRSSLSVALTSSASAKCLAPTGPILLMETLQTGRAQQCQRLLTLGLIRNMRRAAAYSMLVNVLLTPSASARTLASSTPNLLPRRLQAWAGQKCQRLLTLAKSGRWAGWRTSATSTSR